MKIADALNDNDSLVMHISFVQKYSEAFLLKTMEKVMSIPERNIRKSRGALFTSLVTRNGPSSSSARD